MRTYPTLCIGEKEVVFPDWGNRNIEQLIFAVAFLQPMMAKESKNQECYTFEYVPNNFCVFDWSTAQRPIEPIWLNPEKASDSRYFVSKPI